MITGRNVDGCSNALERDRRLVYSWDYLLAELRVPVTGPPIELHLVRHAESVANARGLIAGQSDVGLTWRGYLQSFVLGLRLSHHYDQACVSCLTRAYKTFQIAYSVRSRPGFHVPLCTDPRLNERDLGDLEGMPRRRIEEYAAGDLTYAPNQGESYLELSRRLLSFLMDLRRKVQYKSRIIVTTHVGPLRLLVGIVEGLDDPRSVLALKFENARAYSYILSDLRWPAFISKEVVFGRSRNKVGVANGASHHS